MHTWWCTSRMFKYIQWGMSFFLAQGSLSLTLSIGAPSTHSYTKMALQDPLRPTSAKPLSNVHEDLVVIGKPTHLCTDLPQTPQKIQQRHNHSDPGSYKVAYKARDTTRQRHTRFPNPIYAANKKEKKKSTVQNTPQIPIDRTN